MIKDVSRFHNRDMKRSIMIDSLPLSFILTPENGLLCEKYDAEMVLPDQDDEFLLML